MTRQSMDIRTGPSGNYYDKYASKHPLERLVMANFIANLQRLVANVRVEEIHEVGCGEGNLSLMLARQGYRTRGSDLSEGVVAQARARGEAEGLPVSFKVAGIENLTAPEDRAELVLCCEVLEHLVDPAAALDTLKALAAPYLLTSVPREPLWRILNMARGRYWQDLGNTPGHLQHWSASGFLRMLEKYFTIVEVARPLPWTMVLCRSK
ncbi:MAG: class I SAM-dependent methyltransferase [Gammaproteobacteria bacterium]|nr:class I SAM-dependent methyltransferase [Gammaproteobacteria bacterium]MCW8927243.1 class I SAM-dependent methyltransferase [Gammaproteobacteria bacterium]MCW8957660.1 class I SAM-dependent methyltransferase [Gammaproteobacteria bacterium]MCW8971711.1 class I SAM-dependent methyltransferase [Gammaproteobacteria bacterium]MCW8993384.1 class I SAM-dependent methyltransferase [Gammaproteobacteria bacterium]